VLLFLSILFINTGIRKMSIKISKTLRWILMVVFEARLPPILWATLLWFFILIFRNNIYISIGL
jgi:hypothetical protein